MLGERFFNLNAIDTVGQIILYCGVELGVGAMHCGMFKSTSGPIRCQ